MTVRTTGRLVVACGVLGCLLAFLRWWDTRPVRPGTPSAPLLDIPAHRLTWIHMTVEGSSIKCQRIGERWFLESPTRPPADEEAVERFLSTLDGLRPLERITESQWRERELRPADFGLDPPQTWIEFGDGSRQHRLDLGMDTWLGSSLYARLDQSPDILVLSRDLRDVLPRHATEWRSRRLVSLVPDRLVRIEIRRPGFPFVQLIASQGAWLIQQPAPMRVDPQRVRILLESLTAARIRRLLCDPVALDSPPVTPSTLAFEGPSDPQWGLSADEALRIALWHRGEHSPVEVWLGRPSPESPEEVYARVRPGDTVVTIDRALLEMFSLSPLDLRDRRLFTVSSDKIRELRFRDGDMTLVLARTGDGWALREPFNRCADSKAVDALLDRMVELSAEAFRAASPELLASSGLDRSSRRVEIISIGSERSAEAMLLGSAVTSAVQTLRLASVPDEAGWVWGQINHEDVLCLIREERFRSLEIFPLAYHRFVERTILTIPHGTVRQLALRTEGKEQVVELTQDGGWVALHPEGARVRHARVRDVLGRLESLTATRVFPESPDPADSRGLRTPRATLVISLTGAGDIQKVLRFGAAAGSDGVWVHVQGVQMVFVVDFDTVQTLTADLLETAASPAPP